MLRRQLIAGGVATFCCGAHTASAGSTTLGCSISEGDLDRAMLSSRGSANFDIDTDRYTNGSGDRDFDRALAHTLAQLSDMFNVLPGFAFFDDSDSLNAAASTSQRLGRRDGSVVFGKKLLTFLMKYPSTPEAGVAAVCAHEFGHIAQYKLGLDRKLMMSNGRVKRLELHADFMSGYFAGRRKLEISGFPAAVFAATQDRFGDTAFNDPDHHGTSQERGAAVVAGFDCAFRDRKDFATAIGIGVQYALHT
jgi:hypothetical protein